MDGMTMQTTVGVNLKQLIEKLPKIELHAHINGSISPITIDKLIALRKQKDPEWDSDNSWRNTVDKGCKTLQECFAVFPLIQNLVDNEEAAFIATTDVILEFALEDQVKYLELRTTPRAVPATGMTKASYVNSVVAAIRACNANAELDIIVRLLLAIDRRTSVEDAWDTLDMADRLRTETKGLVLGLDLSGDPHVRAEKFLPVLQEAKKRGLKLTLHMAEIEGMNDENKALMMVPPDRIGHGVYLHPAHGGTDELLSLAHNDKIPIEICLTSNITTGAVKDIKDHCFLEWKKINHPCAICTDDKGVFSTSLNQEFLLACETFQLTPQELWDLTFQSIDCIFEGDEVKMKLKEKFLSSKNF